MGTHRKKWSSKEKIEAVQLLKSKGISEASRVSSVSSTTLYQWELIFDKHGFEGFESKKKTVRDQLFHDLEKQVRELKMIVAEKELELRVVNALLKKSR